jgi:hypothetical protein
VVRPVALPAVPLVVPLVVRPAVQPVTRLVAMPVARWLLERPALAAASRATAPVPTRDRSVA